MFYKTHNLILFSPFLLNLTKLQLDWKRLTGFFCAEVIFTLISLFSLYIMGLIFHKLFAHTVASLVNKYNKNNVIKRAKMVLVCVCVCVCVCVWGGGGGHVYVVYEDRNLYNDMGMT